MREAGSEAGGAVGVATTASPTLGAPEGGRSGAPAVLTFLSNWQQLQHGAIVAGGLLVLQYEPARFSDCRVPNDMSNDGAPGWEIVGYARFLPGGQLEAVSLLGRPQESTPARGGTPVPVAAEIPVPMDAEEVELWFQATSKSTGSCWDSRFGENYRYPVIPAGPVPAPAVSLRAGAVIDPKMIYVAEDAAVKDNATPSRPGYPSSRSILETRLHVGAWVRTAAAAEEVWIDVHVFDSRGALVRSATLPLRLAGPADDDGELYRLDDLLFQGAVATPGSVSPKPDVRRLQYRLYCEADGRVFTDGRLHTCELATDVVSR